VHLNKNDRPLVRMPTIKGTASVADDHAMAKQLKQTKFPKIFSKKIKVDKVNVPVVSQWIETQIASMLGFEDEIVASMAVNLFLDANESNVDPRKCQLSLVGFLGDEKAAAFSASLWALLVDAQSQPSGIPKVLLEEKKAELLKARQAQETRSPPQQQRPPPQGNNGRAVDNRRPRNNNPEGYHREHDHRREQHHERNYDRRPPPPHPAHPPRGYRGPLPARAVSPGRPGVDEFGRVVVPADEDDRKPRAYDERSRRPPRELHESDRHRDRRHYRDEYRGDYRDRHSRDDRRRYYSRDRESYDDRGNGSRRRRGSEESRPSLSSRSSSSSASSSRSRSRSRSSSRSRSRSPS
jgi:serine/arginine repetitive matrix protein 1